MQFETTNGELDRDLWFPCRHHEGARDYLVPSITNTFVGRLPAWCETRDVGFRVSLEEIPDGAPQATRLWIRGFLAGSVPPYDDETDELEPWIERVDAFLRTGRWPLDPEA